MSSVHGIRLSAIPFLRIVIPQIAGILTFSLSEDSVIPLAITVAAVCMFASSAVCPLRFYRIKYIWTRNSGFFLVFMLVGWLSSYISQPRELDFRQLGHPLLYTFHINEIRHQNTSTRLLGEATVDKQNIRLVLTLQGNRYELQPGDNIGCFSKISTFQPPSSPYAFDYSNYMRQNGYLYHSFAADSLFCKLSHAPTVLNRSVKLRQMIVGLIQQLDIDAGPKNFLITTLAGDKRFLSEDDKEAFSKSGLAHILAISGLHIGILIMLLSIILYPIPNHRLPFLKPAIITLAIWSFTYLTGLSPSAVRAAIMGSLLLITQMFRRRYTSLNSLMAAAFIILLFSPASLFDIGFQLSFISVLSILIFSNQLTPKVKSPVLRYFLSAIAVTVSAQFGTFPLIIAYFQNFPTSFLISNLLAVPLLPIVMCCGFIGIILSACGLSLPLLNDVINSLYHIISEATQLSQSLLPPLENIHISLLPCWLLILAILATGFLRNQRLHIRYYILPLSFCSVGLLLILLEQVKRPTTEILLSGNFDTTDIIYYNNRTAYIINSANDTSLIETRTGRDARFYSTHPTDLIIKVQDSVSAPGVFTKYPFASILGKRYVFLRGNLNRKYAPEHNRIKVDYAIITNRYYNQIPDIYRYFEADTIIVPTEIFSERRDTLIHYLRKHHIPCKILH